MGVLRERTFAIVALFLAMATSSPLEELLVQAHGISLIQKRAAAVWQKAPSYVGTLHGDLRAATVTQNNLGGWGPDTGEQKIVYKNVGVGGTGGNQFSINMVVTNTSTYTPNAPHRNGKTAGFGYINVKCGSKVNLKFEFINSNNGKLISFDQLYLSFLELDTGNKEQVKEYVEFGPGIEEYYLSPDTQLIQTNFSNGGYKWLATEAGSGNTNPKSPLTLTPVQEAQAVTLRFGNVNPINLLVGTTPRDNGQCQNGTGRNLMFGFESTLLCATKNKKDKEWDDRKCRRKCNEASNCHSKCGQKCTTYCACNPPMASPTPCPTDTTTTTTCATCVIWGDPHVLTFAQHKKRLVDHPKREAFFRTRGWKNDQTTINEAGTFWIVKSDQVHIQAKYARNETLDTTTLVALHVGGPFLNNNVLTMRPLSGNSTWDGRHILRQMPSNFENDLISAKYHAATEMVKDGTRGPGVDIGLPMGVKLIVNRWKKSLAVQISMCGQGGSQGGQCGPI